MSQHGGPRVGEVGDCVGDLLHALLVAGTDSVLRRRAIEIDNNGAERAFRVVCLGRNEAKAMFMRSPPFGVDAGGRGQVVEGTGSSG